MGIGGVQRGGARALAAEAGGGARPLGSFRTTVVDQFENGETWISGTFGRDRRFGTVRVTGDGRFDLTERDATGRSKPWRPLAAEEQHALVAALEREIALDRAPAADLRIILPRLKPPPPAAGAIALGHVPSPGKRLARITGTLRPGETLKFTTAEDVTQGLGAIHVKPPGALVATRTPLELPPRGFKGASIRVEYAFTVAPEAKPGSTIVVRATGNPVAHTPEDWAFSFKVKVGLPF